jgi:hypothetical protein
MNDKQYITELVGALRTARVYVLAHEPVNYSQAHDCALLLDSIDKLIAMSCKHDAISPTGTMFYHGFVGQGGKMGQWRCSVCRNVFTAELEDNDIACQKLILKK